MSAINPKMLITVAIEFLMLPLVSFLAAGTLFWFYSWIFWILFYSSFFGICLWVLRHNPGLIKERMIGFKPDDLTRDKAHMVLIPTLFVV